LLVILGHTEVHIRKDYLFPWKFCSTHNNNCTLLPQYWAGGMHSAESVNWYIVIQKDSEGG